MDTKRIALALAPAALLLATGCVTVAEHRKLERRVVDMQRAESGGTPDRERLAEIAASLQGLEEQLRRLEGRIEVTEHRVGEAMHEARAARESAASTTGASMKQPDGSVLTEEEVHAVAPLSQEMQGMTSDEVAAYREAYAAWRAGDANVCVERFRGFLQRFPSSSYADDSAYWLADCYFKSGDYKTAVLRFDDVVSRYPEGNKAPDALYKQGEALLRLGPGYGKAAGKAFERVVREYPDSTRAVEARRQLDLLKSG